MEIFNELENIDIELSNYELDPLELFDFSMQFPNDNEELGDPIAIEVSIRG